MHACVYASVKELALATEKLKINIKHVEILDIF